MNDLGFCPGANRRTKRNNLEHILPIVSAENTDRKVRNGRYCMVVDTSSRGPCISYHLKYNRHTLIGYLSVQEIMVTSPPSSWPVWWCGVCPVVVTAFPCRTPSHALPKHRPAASNVSVSSWKILCSNTDATWSVSFALAGLCC